MAAISCRTCFRNIRFCRNVSHHSRRRAQTTRHLCSSSGDKDVKDHDLPAFNDATVQKLLKRITGMNFEKIFPRVKQKLSPPKYKLVSEDKLQELLEEAKKKAEKKLQMPPVMEERTKIDHVLSNDPELEGLETSKLVFTDITFGVPDRERFVVVREPTGVLRHADWDERARMLQIYFPRDGRKIEPPEIFEDENMEHVFSEDRHKDLLDICCVQFEPDDPHFIHTHHTTYEHIVKTENYDLLRSTRHFGGMAYYLTKRKRIDGLLKDMIQRNLINDAMDLLSLYHLLHPQCPSAIEKKKTNLKGIDIIKAFIGLDAENGPALELVLQAYENEKQILQTDTSAASSSS